MSGGKRATKKGHLVDVQAEDRRSMRRVFESELGIYTLQIMTRK